MDLIDAKQEDGNIRDDDLQTQIDELKERNDKLNQEFTASSE